MYFSKFYFFMSPMICAPSLPTQMARCTREGSFVWCISLMNANQDFSYRRSASVFFCRAWISLLLMSAKPRTKYGTLNVGVQWSQDQRQVLYGFFCYGAGAKRILPIVMFLFLTIIKQFCRCVNKMYIYVSRAQSVCVKPFPTSHNKRWDSKHDSPWGVSPM